MTHRRPHTEAELVEFVRSIDVPAPESLHRSVESLIARRAGERGSGPRRAIALIYRGLGSTPRLALAGAGGAAPRVSGGHTDRRHGTPYRLVRENGALVVTWLRAGHMCVLSGSSDVDAATLLRLASWHGSVSA